MKIAIVDDAQADRRLLLEKLEQYTKEQQLVCEIVEFDSAEAFLKVFTPDGYALVFMDIYMEGMSGMAAAKRIFEMDRECKIIFLTISRNYTIQGYAVRALYYLVKPIDDAEFLRAMGMCEFNGGIYTRLLTVVSDGIELSLPTDTIVYIDYIDRVTRVHTTKQVINVAGTFGEVTAPLRDDKRFIVCIRSLIVNMRYIRAQDGDMFVLRNGERLPISIRYKKFIGRAFRQFIYEEMGDVN